MVSEGAAAGLERMTATLLAGEASPTPDGIRNSIASLRALPMFVDVTDDDAEAIARRFESRLGVTMQIGSVLTAAGFEPWLEDALPHTDPYFWARYRWLLEQRHFPRQVIAALDETSNRILGRLENPEREGPWDRRGLVVGHVQSGKTANYVGLMAKAADAGYQFIVVIAGIHNNLRNQTQIRIDEGFVGRDSSRFLSTKGSQYVGVGTYDRTRMPISFTNSIRDFNKDTARALGISLRDLPEPVVVVIKKNPSTLRNLTEWLREYSGGGGGQKIAAPMLLIDDEADNASINISSRSDEVSRINGQIRKLMGMFSRACYVGYTATPFANIFIDPDTEDDMVGADLFPRDFIVGLDPPTNYFGPPRVFLDEGHEIVQHIEDHEPFLPLKHRVEHRVDALPPSLQKAIRTFVVACALRSLRDEAHFHASMLINVSRFVAVQRQVRNEVHAFLDGVKAYLRVNGMLPAAVALADPEIRALHEVWRDEYDDGGVKWGDVQASLHEVVAPVSVVEVNSRSSGALNYAAYEKGLRVIAVGGLSLSRGLTLEGLTVSYFLRNSMMYDTLMQMGRWFGYREGYEDLCRIWMPEAAAGWYTHIAESIEMLADELRRMEAANRTPIEFGLKVRSHPDSLLVTARNKMGTGERLRVKVGLANHFIETFLLSRDEADLHANVVQARAFITDLRALGYLPDAPAMRSGGYFVGAVPSGPIVSFIQGFKNHPGAVLTEVDPVCRYIADRDERELANWDVLIASRLRGDAGEKANLSLGLPIFPQRRTEGGSRDPRSLYVSSKQRVASRGIERVGVTEELAVEAERNYRDTLVKEGKLPRDDKPINYPDRIYRRVRERPLFILHTLDVTGESGSTTAIAWGISFPHTEREEDRVEYVVNTTWMKEHYLDDLEEEEMDPDDL